MSMKNSNDTIRNQTRDLPVCSAVPQPTAPPCTPCSMLHIYNNHRPTLGHSLLIWTNVSYESPWFSTLHHVNPLSRPSIIRLYDGPHLMRRWLMNTTELTGRPWCLSSGLGVGVSTRSGKASTVNNFKKRVSAGTTFIKNRSHHMNTQHLHIWPYEHTPMPIYYHVANQVLASNDEFRLWNTSAVEQQPCRLTSHLPSYFCISLSTV
jgi:hypothetical protein